LRALLYIVGVSFGAIMALAPSKWLFIGYLAIAAYILSVVTYASFDQSLARGRILRILASLPSLMIDALEWPANLASRVSAASSSRALGHSDASTTSAYLALKPPILFKPLWMIAIVGTSLLEAQLNGATIYHRYLWLSFTLLGAAELFRISSTWHILLQHLRASVRHVGRYSIGAVFATAGFLTISWRAYVWSASLPNAVSSSRPLFAALRLAFCVVYHSPAIWTLPYFDRLIAVGGQVLFGCILFQFAFEMRRHATLFDRRASDYAQIALHYITLHQFDRAALSAQKGLELQPGDRPCLSVASVAHIAAGNNQRAFELALELSSGRDITERCTCAFELMARFARMLPDGPRYFSGILRMMIDKGQSEHELASLLDSWASENALEENDLRSLASTCAASPLFCATLWLTIGEPDAAEKILASFNARTVLQRTHKEFLLLRAHWESKGTVADRASVLPCYLQENLSFLEEAKLTFSPKELWLVLYPLILWIQEASEMLQLQERSLLAAIASEVKGRLAAEGQLEFGPHVRPTRIAETQRDETIPQSSTARTSGSVRHRPQRFWYYPMITVTCIASFVLAILRPTNYTKSLAAILAISYYADVIRPHKVLNAPPSQRLRRPWSTYLCLLLSAHQPLNFAANATATTFMMFVMISAFGMTWKAYALSPFAVHTAYFCLTRGIVASAKWFLVGSTRIVVFRRFAETTASRHRSMVLPVLGAYGYLLLYADETLSSTPQGPLWETQDLLAGRFYHMKTGDLNWRGQVEYELTRADFAVFDWECSPTESMELELQLSLQRLPEDRLLWIVPDAKVDAIEAIVRKYIPAHKEHLPFIRRDSNYWSFAKTVRRVIAMSRRNVIRPASNQH
jgi:hypothetical protein